MNQEPFKKTEEPDIEETNPDIGTKKPDIETAKPDIEKKFPLKTADYILRLRQAFPGETIFGRSDVMKALGLKTSRTSELLGKLAECGIIEPVSGYGKGKYWFR